MYDMKTSSLTIRLDKELEDMLNKISRQSGRTRSEIARDALRRRRGIGSGYLCDG
ncbi:MAG: ribbon-helix-helix domain-containing protein [Candidatus Aminicenantes bacterium]|nr:ribbon-helix-helix domain-containing protein [Candidatus Aminicenantes bacterium]